MALIKLFVDGFTVIVQELIVRNMAVGEVGFEDRNSDPGYSVSNFPLCQRHCRRRFLRAWTFK